MGTGSKKVSRAEALRALEKIAAEKEEFWYRHICDYALGHKLSQDDRIWLYKRLKEKNITIHGKDPTAKVNYKTWADEDGTLYTDLSRIDYEAVFNEIVRENSRLAPLIDSLRHIRPTQKGEKMRMLSLLEKGDAAARERLIEMHLRSVVTQAYRWAKMIDVDVEEAIGNACITLVSLIDKAPDYIGRMQFSKYMYLGLHWAMKNGQMTHNDQMRFRNHDHSRLHILYDTMKKKGCLDCDKLHHCDKAVDTACTVLQCSPDTARKLLPSVYNPLSLEAYLETAGHAGCAGYCEEIADEEDDAPDYEEELTSYRVDPTEEAETDLVDWDFRKKLLPQLDRLDPKEKEIIELRNGFVDGRQHTLREIGWRYGVSSERIRQIEQIALKKLRDMCRREAHPNKNVSQNKDIKPKENVSQNKDMKPKEQQTIKARPKEEKPKVLLLEIQSGWRKSRRLWELLLDYRIDHRLSRAKMAKLCGISEPTLARLEKPSGLYCPSSSILLKIFENLDISGDTVMDVIKHDEKFRNMNLAWIWDQLNEDRLLKYYHQMNRERREFALAQMKALAEQKKF